MGGFTKRSYRHCELKTIRGHFISTDQFPDRSPDKFDYQFDDQIHKQSYHRSGARIMGKVVCSAFFLLLIVAAFIPSWSHAAEHTLFIATEAESAAAAIETDRFLANPLGSGRWRDVALNPVITGGTGMVKGDTIKVNPFPGVEYSGIVDSIRKNIDGTVTVRASLEGYPYGYLMISTSGQRSLGTIRVPDRGEIYNIMSMPGGAGSYVFEMAPERIDALESGTPLAPEDPLMVGDEPMIPDDDGSDDSTKTGEFGSEEPVTIDVMVVYTPAARRWAVNSGGIHNIIAQAMEKGQLTLDNSQTYVKLNLVHSAEVNYTESGSSATDLSRLRNQGDGYMQRVHVLRDAYQADLVALLAVLHDLGGRAYLLNSRQGRPDSAFSVTRVQQAASSYTLMHELAHNIGLHHCMNQNVSPGPTLWFDWPENRWSAGWDWIGRNGNRYGSLMTYESGAYFNDGQPRIKVAHISNPNVNHDGIPTGHSVNGNNARTMREMKHVVAAYRGATATHTLIYEAGTGGYIGGNARQTIWQGGSGTAVEAVSNNGYHFVQWNDGRKENPRIDRNITTDRVITATFAKSFAGGGGAAGNPFLVSNPEQLARIRYNLSNHYIQQNDIDMAGVEKWGPVGTFNDPFSGVFDGNGYAIRNIAIDGGNSAATGMFGYAQGAVIRNVKIEGADIKGADNVGGLLGQATNTIIEQSSVSGFVSGRENVGGLVGALYALSESVVSNSYADCNVVGAYSVGGLVGRLGMTAVIGNAFAVGDVFGDNSAGGLVGRNTNAAYNNVINSFWDADIGLPTSMGGIGVTTAGMKQKDTFTDWDFDDVWAIGEGRTYPYLRLQPVQVGGDGNDSDSSVECFINTLMHGR